MTQNFNKISEKEKRRHLRKNQTFCEKILWNYLRDRKTLGYKFRRQYSVDHYVIDFYCPELKLAIELDGSVHDVPDQKEYDAYRQGYIEKLAYRQAGLELHFAESQMMNLWAMRIWHLRKLKSK